MRLRPLKVLADLQWGVYLFYLEDIVIDKSNGSKCNLFATKEGIVTDLEKIKAVAEWPIPSDVSDACSFLWLCSYQKQFTSYFASEANFPLIEKHFR